MGPSSENVGRENRSRPSPTNNPQLEIWLVNDDPAQLLVQKRLLGRFAATVWEFSSPDEVVSQAQKYGSCPNLLSDFHMPGMNGLELARIWCELHGNARVLLASASSLSVEEKKEALFLPQNHVKLLSSFNLSELMTTAREWFVGEPEELQDETEPAEETSGLVHFDRAVHSKLMMLGGAAFLKKALDRFADRLPGRMESCREALQSGDLRTVHREAHSLKGSCGIVGATSMLELADQLESAALREEAPDALSLLLKEIEQEWQHSAAELQEVLKGLDAQK